MTLHFRWWMLGKEMEPVPSWESLDQGAAGKGGHLPTHVWHLGAEAARVYLMFYNNSKWSSTFKDSESL